MRTLLISSLFILLSGCSAIPSFWDDNESMLAVEVRYAVDRLDCTDEYQDIQKSVISDRLRRFELYSESRGSDDVGEMLALMRTTVDGFVKDTTNNEIYCKLKKKVLVKQSADIADAVMGRY